MQKRTSNAVLIFCFNLFDNKFSPVCSVSIQFHEIDSGFLVAAFDCELGLGWFVGGQTMTGEGDGADDFAC